MNKGKILFIDTVHPVLNTRLEAMGFHCIDGSEYNMDRIFEILPECNGIVIRSRVKIDKPFLEKATSLKFIARAGAGMENIDVEYATARGIACINAPEANCNAVAEHALGMLLALMNRLAVADREVRNGIWKREENRGYELSGKTVGIIGFGRNGSAFAEKLQGFNCTILAHDPYVKIDKNRFPLVIQSEYPEIFAQCDVISLHVPLTGETRGLVNREFLSLFQKPIWLVNTARGQVVKTADLVEALRENRVMGAALDVLEYESLSFESLQRDQLPEPYRFLTTSDRVLLSPHIAGWTHESHRKISEVLGEKIVRLYQLSSLDK